MHSEKYHLDRGFARRFFKESQPKYTIYASAFVKTIPGFALNALGVSRLVTDNIRKNVYM